MIFGYLAHIQYYNFFSATAPIGAELVSNYTSTPQLRVRTRMIFLGEQRLRSTSSLAISLGRRRARTRSFPLPVWEKGQMPGELVYASAPAGDALITKAHRSQADFNLIVSCPRHLFS
jgi:hypothetical protein